MNEEVRKYMSEMGKKSWESRKKNQNMSELAKKRWEKKKESKK